MVGWVIKKIEAPLIQGGAPIDGTFKPNLTLLSVTHQPF